MSTAAIFGVIDALVTRFTSSAPTGVVVFDGPSVNSPSTLEAVIVGSDDVLPGDYRTGREDQVWRSVGAVSKDATGTVTCAVLAQNGTTNVPERRARAAAILATLETALRNDIDLDGGSVLYTGLSTIEVRQQLTNDGAVVRIVFLVNYRARL